MQKRNWPKFGPCTASLATTRTFFFHGINQTQLVHRIILSEILVALPLFFSQSESASENPTTPLPKGVPPVRTRLSPPDASGEAADSDSGNFCPACSTTRTTPRFSKVLPQLSLQQDELEPPPLVADSGHATGLNLCCQYRLDKLVQGRDLAKNIGERG
ncbi:hypothetical protein VTJ04DRAFT_7538 [Mycothermus thermophilus]|uniref:uncharacterized protein n=1 Tax=Humicola insolens TaxID=85995 RepID=UPI00374402C2